MSDASGTTFQIEVSDAASQAILHTYNHIQYVDKSPQNAALWLGRITDAIDDLRTMPTRHGFYSTRRRRARDLRQVIVDNLLIVFTILDDEATVHVLDVRNCV